MDSPILVGVDIGTTRIKAVVVSPDGTEHDIVSERTPWLIRGTTTEADPNAIASAAIRVITQAVNNYQQIHPSTRVVGVGVTGMAEAGVIVDRGGNARSPMYAWHDPRGVHAQVAADLPNFGTRTGMPISPVASIMKMPMLLAAAGPAAQHFLNVPEWVAFRLGGERFSEISLASRTGLYDVAHRRWWNDGFEFIGRDVDLMPGEPRPGIEGAGRATLSVIAGAELVVAGHDHQVAAYGEQAIGASRLFDSLGTAEALVRTTNICPDDAAIRDWTKMGFSIGATVIADHWVALAGFHSGHMLERTSRLLGIDDHLARQRIARRAVEIEPNPELSIARTDEHLSIGGITDDVEPAHLWRAVVEYADSQVGGALEYLDRLFGAPTDVTIAGGWLNDAAVRFVKQRRFGEFRTAVAVESGAVGAARMAGIKAEVVDDPTSAACSAANTTD